MSNTSPKPQGADADASAQDTLYASRRKLYVRAVSGIFDNWRWALVWITQLIFYGLPWLQWNDRQAVLLHLVDQNHDTVDQHRHDRLRQGRMIAQAQALGADAVICVRYGSSSITQQASEVMAYGTAVKFK